MLWVAVTAYCCVYLTVRAVLTHQILLRLRLALDFFLGLVAVLAPPHRYPAFVGLALGIHHHSGRLRSYTYILSVYLTRVCLVIMYLRDSVNSVSYPDNG